MSREDVRPHPGAIIKPFRIENEETNIATAELNVQAGYLVGGRSAVENNIHTMIEVGCLGGLKRDNQEFMENGLVNSRDGITEKDDEGFLRRLVQQGSQGDLCLVGQRLGLVKHDDLGGRIVRKERLKRGPNEGIDTASDGLQTTLVAGIQEEGATKKGGRSLLSVERLYKVSGRGGFTGTRRTD